MANTIHHNNVSKKNPRTIMNRKILSFLYSWQIMKFKEQYFDKSTGNGFPKYSFNQSSVFYDESLQNWITFLFLLNVFKCLTF